MNPENVVSTFGVVTDFSYIIIKTAISMAEKGLRIWCITLKPINEIPSNIIRPEREILQLITFIYLKDWKELIEHLNNIHNWHNQPDAILLSSFEKYCDLYSTSYKSVITAYICAMLLDSGASCATKKCARTLNNSKKFYLLVMCSQNDDDKDCVDSVECRKKLQVIKDVYFSKFLYRTDFETDDLFVLEVLNEFGIINNIDNIRRKRPRIK